uniref:Uncharacterized protein n=1 Tax=Magallana gigas TaxID=29159 RepID=A0A8W8M609_MAGGI
MGQQQGVCLQVYHQTGRSDRSKSCDGVTEWNPNPRDRKTTARKPVCAQANQRVLHHKSELTNFVSRLTEEKMELRNTLGRLEEDIWRYRQRDTE